MIGFDSNSDLERLRDAIDAAWEQAHKFGLDPFPTHFEMVPASIMYEFASYGLPGRFSHWTHGKAYYRQKMQYDLGLSKIYEMVVNTNPSYAFLMEMNNLLQNTFVAAHVFGHTDFFKNNVYFQHTSRRMIDKASIHAERIAKYEFDHGREEVERFLDAALAIQEHVDYNLLLRREGGESKPSNAVMRTTEYDDLWNLDERAERAEEERSMRPGKPPKFPEKPEKDIMLFLINHAPYLQPWQRDILEIVRQEMLYFVPQMQTKIMNEGWACLVADSLVQTEYGLMRYDALHRLLARGQTVQVASGEGICDRITDRHVRRNAPVIRLHTRRGLVLEGAEEHKLSVGPEQWMSLQSVRVGQRVPLAVGENIWPQEEVALSGSAPRLVARQGGTQTAVLGLPTTVTAGFAEFLGYLCYGGRVDPLTGRVCFTCQDEAVARRYVELVTALFSVDPETIHFTGPETNRWYSVFRSPEALELVHSLEMQNGVPEVILRSPRLVVNAFLKACFALTGQISEGLVLTAPSEQAARTLQCILLNYGVLSWRDGAILRITGSSARVFAEAIGLTHVQEVQTYLRNAPDEAPFDEVVRIERTVADVYDITVQRSHRYIANGMLHHNSFWHARIMRALGEQNVISDAETIEFAQLHSSVLSPSRTSLNPYYIGFKILEDIERRWDNPTREERERLGRQPGKGREKLFEVRELDNDVSFLRNYLTEDLVKDLDLYLYKKEGDEWVIVEKDWRKVRDTIVSNMTNFGYPYIVVDDGDYRGNRELYLKHMHEGQDLDMPYAEKTLQHIYHLWGRPVHLETVFDGKRILLSYDGERNSKSTLEK